MRSAFLGCITSLDSGRDVIRSSTWYGARYCKDLYIALPQTKDLYIALPQTKDLYITVPQTLLAGWLVISAGVPCLRLQS